MIDEVQRLAVETIQKNKQAIVFVPSRASAEKAAEKISGLASFSFPELENEILKVASVPTKQCRRLSHCVRKGVAFHHAGLLSQQKELIEDEFRSGKIKIVCATPTLAAGLSLPAFRVIIKSLKRFSGFGSDWIPVLEYLQMAGRAGRPEYETFGEAIAIAKNEGEKEEIYANYICGVPEEIYSKLAVEPALRTYLLSLISSGIIYDEKSMREFFSRTFWAQQFQDMQKLEQIMQRMLELLIGWGFVYGTMEEGFVSAAGALKNKTEKRLKATLLGRRVSELYLDPLTARHLLDSLTHLDEEKKSFSLLQMVSHTLEMRPLLRIKVKEQDQIQEELTKNYGQLLKPEPSAFDLEYDFFMSSIKTALFFSEWVEEKDEDFLFENYGITPGEVRVKLETADWLLYAALELSKIESNHLAVRELNKLRIRVKYGAKEDLLPLLKLKGIGRVRARKLVFNGLADLGALKKADLSSLSQILGKIVAEDVKKQLGEEIEEIAASTRKGQLSMTKFGAD